jgi:hypothetical protein
MQFLKAGCHQCGKFVFTETEEKIVSLENELERLKQFNIFMPRQNKIKRIIETYENIKFN